MGTAQAQRVKAVPLTGSIGAAIPDIRLADIDDDGFAAIRAAFLDHCMLVFPGQHLDVVEHVEFAQRWGTFNINPFVSYLDDHPGVLPLTNRGKAGTVTENWHYDSMFMAEPPSMTILSARQLPLGGDTMWSNQYLAYERLSPGMQAMIDGLRIEFAGTRLAKLAGTDEVPSTLHPLVRTHPETGRKALLVGHPGDTAVRIEDMTEAESRPLISYLYETSTLPDRVYRHRWQEGDVVMWDNRCTMHYAVHDHGDESVRELHRISIDGDTPY